MAAIVKNSQRSVVVNELFDTFRNRPTENSLYVAIGRNSPWSSDTTPPIPIDSIQEEKDFWNNMVGLVKVDIDKVMPVVKKYIWKYGTVFNPINESSAMPDALEPMNGFYCLNRDDDVFFLISKTGSSQVVLEEPTRNSPNYNLSTQTIATSDGHTWQYNYPLNLTYADLLTDYWMPVNPTNAQVSSEINNPIFKMGSRLLMVYCKLDVNSLPINPLSTTYRQIALIRNPRLLNGDIATSLRFVEPNIATLSSPSISSLIPYSGQMMFLENKRPVSRTGDLVEEIRIIIEY